MLLLFADTQTVVRVLLFETILETDKIILCYRFSFSVNLIRH